MKLLHQNPCHKIVFLLVFLAISAYSQTMLPCMPGSYEVGEGYNNVSCEMICDPYPQSTPIPGCPRNIYTCTSSGFDASTGMVQGPEFKPVDIVDYRGIVIGKRFTIVKYTATCPDNLVTSHDVMTIVRRFPENQCTDGLDNNSDGSIDCDDPSCASSPECPGRDKPCVGCCGGPDATDRGPSPEPSKEVAKLLYGGDGPQCCKENQSSGDSTQTSTPPAPTPCEKEDGDPIGVNSGFLTDSRVDITLPGRMVAAVIPYFHSDLEYMGHLGFGWSSILGVRLFHWPDSTWSLRDHWGRREDFAANGTNSTKRFYSGNLDLSHPDSVLMRIDRDHIFAFDRTDGVLLRVRDDRGAHVDLQYESANSEGSFPGAGPTRRKYPIKGISTYSVPRGLRSIIAMDYRVTSVVDGDDPSRKLDVTYDTSGQISSITDPAGRVVSYRYDLAGNLEQVTLPDGTLRRYRWNDPSSLHRMTAFDARPIRPSWASDTSMLTRNSWDRIGRVTKQSWQGADYSFQRAPYGSTKTLDTNGDTLTTWTRMTNLTRVEPDGLGGSRNTAQVFTDVVVNRTPANGPTTWDSRTETVIRTVNGLSDTAIIRYNSDNSVQRKRRPDGTTVSWSQSGNIQTVTERPRTGGGPVRTTTVTLDAQGRVVRQEVLSEGTPSQVNTWTWLNGLLQSQCQGDGDEALCSQRQYDAQKRLANTTDATGGVTTLHYPTNSARQPDSVTFADGTGERYRRDVLGRIVSVRNSMMQTRTVAYDALGRDTLSCGFDGACRRSVYDGPDLVRLEEGGHLLNGAFAQPLRTVRYEVDGHGRRIKEWLVTPTREVLKRKSVVDAFGNVAEVWDNPDSTKTDSLLWRLVERNRYDGRDHRIEHRLFPAGAAGAALLTTSIFDAAGHEIRTTDPRQAVSRRSYDAWGNILVDTNALGAVTRRGYDAGDRVVADTNAVGQVTSHAYNAQGHETRRVGFRLDTTLWIYTAGRLVKERTPEGSWTTYQHDALGRVTRVVRKVGDTAQVADGDDIVTEYVYDALGNRIRESVAGMVQHRYGFDAAGRMVLDTNALGEVTQILYDRLGRVVRQISTAGDSLSTDYDAQGRVSVRRLLAVGQAADTLSVVRYDDAARPVWERTPGQGAVTREYDGTDFTTKVTDSVGIVTTMTQDKAGRDSLVSVAGKPPRKTVRDALGRVTQQFDERGFKIVMAYDHLDRLTRLTDNEGNATVFAWSDSSKGWTKRITTYADAKFEIHYWDREGRLRRLVDGRGIVAHYGYDSLSRMKRIEFLTPEGVTASDPVVLGYDKLSRLVKASQGTLWDSTEYDPLGRPARSLQSVDGTTYSLVYAYGPRSRTLTLPDGSTTTQRWTARGLLDSVWAGARLLARFQYGNGLETSRVLGNGIEATSGYDGAGRISSMAYALAGQTLPNLGFGYDPSGNRSLIRRSHAPATSEAVGYTTDNQVSSWSKGVADASGVIATPTTSQAWSLDSRGNWSSWTQNSTTQTRTHSGANQVTAMGSVALAWDAAGNLSNDGTRNYVWNARGLLESVAEGAATLGTYTYDPLGRRVAKSVDGVTSLSIYDGWQDVYSVVKGGSVDTSKSWVFGNYIDEPLAMIRKWGSSSDTVWYLQGNNFNVEALTDRTGAIVERYEHTPYGAARVYSGSGTDGTWFTGDDVGETVSARGNELTFQGRELDGETGNLYFRARYYMPTLGRFVSRDPLRYGAGDVNEFRFTSNAPLGYVDPLGLYSMPSGIRYSEGDADIRFDVDAKSVPVLTGVWGEVLANGGTETAPSFSGECSGDCKRGYKIKKPNFVLEVKLRILDESSDLWKTRWSQEQDDLIGRSTSSAAERQSITFNHEMDHYRAWVGYFGFMAGRIFSAIGQTYSTQEECDAAIRGVRSSAESNYKRALQRTHWFDRVERSGNLYGEHHEGGEYR